MYARLVAPHHVARLLAPCRRPAPVLSVHSLSARRHELALFPAHTQLPARVRLPARVDSHRVVGPVEVITEGAASRAPVHAAVLRTYAVPAAVNHDVCTVLVLVALASARPSLARRRTLGHR